MPLDLARLSAEQLRTLIENADRRGAAELSARAFKQLCTIQPAAAADDGLPADDPVRLAYSRALTAAEELKTRSNKRTTRLSRTRQKAKRDGIIATMEAMALKPQPSDGFQILLEGGHPELAFESIIAEHPRRFSEAAVAAARKRLADHGLDR